MRSFLNPSAMLGCLMVFIAAHGLAHFPVAPQILEPKTPAEAWNVIRLSTANVTRLLREQRLQEVAQQISLCSPSLRLLATASAPEHRTLIDGQTALAFRLVNELAQAAMSREQERADTSFTQLQAVIEAMKPAFAPEIVRSEIYTCPDHPEVIATTPGEPCSLCKRVLRIRRIPYTDVYVSQVPSAIALTLEMEKALVPGAPTRLTARLRNPAGTPVPASDLLPLDGAPLHLLLLDQHLDDFHIITPPPAEKPGEWRAEFVPANPGTYRVWAEFAPVETALPEYAVTELGGEFAPVGPAQSGAGNRLSATSHGLRFQISFTGGNADAPPSRQVSLIYVQITDSAGQPFNRLEPFMRAFGHLSGIYEDGKQILRLQPVSGDILRDDVRGGPSLAFKIYPPKTGIIRFFCQVRIDGKIISVPFDVNVTK